MSTTEAQGVPAVPPSTEERFYGKETPAASEPEKQAKPAESEPAKPSEAKPAETAPESEPGKTTEEPKPLTDDERSERDRKNQERRRLRTAQENAVLKAEIRRRDEAAASSKTTTKPESAPGPNGKFQRPDLEKFNTIDERDDAFEAEVRADERKKAREEFEHEQSELLSQRQIEEVKSKWSAAASTFIKAQKISAEDWTESYAHVTRTLEGTPAEEVLAAAIQESAHPAELFWHYADNDTALAELRKMGRYTAGKAVAAAENDLGKAPPPNTSRAPRVPSTVSGNGSSTPKLTTEDKFYGKE